MKNLKTSDWMLIAGEAGLFFIVTIVVWLDEFMDLPARFLGATPKPYRPQEYLVEAVSILIVAVVAITITFIALRRVRRVERFLRVCAWCRKIWVDGEWVSLEEYALKMHSLKSSHGICEECVTGLEKKNGQKRAVRIEGLTDKPPHHMRMRYQKPLQ